MTFIHPERRWEEYKVDKALDILTHIAGTAYAYESVSTITTGKIKMNIPYFAFINVYYRCIVPPSVCLNLFLCHKAMAPKPYF